jgi:uncharacterized protein (DUF697 family)
MASGIVASAQPEKTIAARLLKVISTVPSSAEPSSITPQERSRDISRTSAWKAAGISGALALPPGPAGLATVIPDLVAIWHIQRQMVADIAAAFGKTAYLGREQMLYCLFKHTASHAVGRLVVSVGGRVLVRRVSLRVIQRILRRLGIVITQRVVGRVISRWIPFIGAGAIAAYAYFDTANVARTTVALFEKKFKKMPSRAKKEKARRPKTGSTKKRPSRTRLNGQEQSVRDDRLSQGSDARTPSAGDLKRTPCQSALGRTPGAGTGGG